LFFFIR